jgi:hypothetical protein
MAAWAPGAWAPGAWAGTAWAETSVTPTPEPERRGFIDIPPAFRDEPEAVLFLIAAAYYRTH